MLGHRQRFWPELIEYHVSPLGRQYGADDPPEKQSTVVRQQRAKTVKRSGKIGRSAMMVVWVVMVMVAVMVALVVAVAVVVAVATIVTFIVVAEAPVKLSSGTCIGGGGGGGSSDKNFC